MITYHFDKWNKNGKRLATYLNENGTEEQFNKLDENISRLENIVMEKTKYLFNGKDTFIWLALFEKFTQFELDDAEFSRFLEAFVDGLRNKSVNGQLFDRVDDTGSTKDKANIVAKLHILETLMREYLHIEDNDELVNEEEFISEIVDLPIESVKEDMDFYEETLTDLENNTIRDGSKLLEVANHLSLLAMVAYSYKHDIDLEDWMTEFAAKNNTYIKDTKRNFYIMVDDLKKYNKKVGIA